MNKKNQEQKIGNTYVRIFSVSEISNCSKIGLRAVRDLGDRIDQLYKGDPIAQKYAVSAWKEYVSLAQTWYAYAPKGEAEAYAEKIKKIEPSYVMPSKAGCISFGKKQ